MKKCPFCAEEIQDEAIKCKHCGEFFEERPAVKPKEKWYFRNYTLIVGLLMLGPFVLPLVWLNPRFDKKLKIIISVVVTVVGFFMIKASINTVNSLRESIATLESIYAM